MTGVVYPAQQMLHRTRNPGRRYRPNGFEVPKWKSIPLRKRKFMSIWFCELVEGSMAVSLPWTLCGLLYKCYPTYCILLEGY
jgi:hypothetical protein